MGPGSFSITIGIPKLLYTSIASLMQHLKFITTGLKHMISKPSDTSASTF